MKVLSKTKLLRAFKYTQRVQEQRHFYAIRTAFISTMPVMIVGAIALAINAFPIPAYRNFMALMFGGEWMLFGNVLVASTSSLASLMIVFSICSSLTKWYNTTKNRQASGTVCGIIGISVFLIASVPLAASNELFFEKINANFFNVISSYGTFSCGIFIAIIVAVVVAEIFVASTSSKRVNRLLSNDPNLAVPQAFAAILPAALLVASITGIRMALAACGVMEGLGELLNNLLQLPFKNAVAGIGTGIMYNVYAHIMWVFGIHGYNVLNEVSVNFLVPATVENAAAVAAGGVAPNIVTSTVFDVFVNIGGSGATLALIIALIIHHKGRANRTLIRYALPTAILNINEPVLYGMPLIMNFTYAIPFVLTPLVNFLTTMLAMKIGIVPYTVTDVGWSMPIFLSGYIATGSIAGVLLQIVNLFLGVCIYTPFVQFSIMVENHQFKQAYEGLCKIVNKDYSNARGLVRRADEIGAVARKLANQLETAVQGKEIGLHYQPIINARSNSMHSVEALLRWNHPEYGYINPMVVIAIAEETGGVDKLGMWVIDKAIEQRAEWTKQGLQGFHVSVNASTHQLNVPLFHEQVRLLLQKHRVPSHQLQIEITETAALIESAATIGNLARLHDMGVSLAMDDFGVGHSSLIYLRTQPITTLKLDGALTRDVVRQPVNLDIIATIVDLCKLMKVEMIAEVVENERQLNMLMGVGLHLMQGYLYSEPIAGEEIPGFLYKLKNAGPRPTGGE